LRVANWTRVVAELLDGDDVDLGFADVSERQQDTDLNVETVRTSQMFFYCRAGHPLAGRKARTIEEALIALTVDLI
jgi:DNA-binding transcriptional LysR family regulator